MSNADSYDPSIKDSYNYKLEAGKLRKFLWFCSGTDIQILSKCPHSERVKAEGITNITPLVNDYEEMMMKYMVDRANSDAGFLSKMTKIAGNTFKFLSNIIGSAFLSPSLDDSEHDDHDSHCGCSHDSEDEDDSESS